MNASPLRRAGMAAGLGIRAMQAGPAAADTVWVDTATSFKRTTADSADRTYGNYGHKYDTTLRLFNTTGSPRSVRVSFGSNFTAATSTPSFTFSTPASFNGARIDLWTTPTQPRQTIGTYTAPASGFFDARLTMFIAGLGVTNRQFIVETIN